MQANQKNSKIIIILSLIGWPIALYLLWHGIKLSTVGLDGDSICSISSFLDCDAVAMSSYSVLFGLPVAAYLGAFYAVVFSFSLWSYFSLQDDHEDNHLKANNIVFVLSLLFSLISVWQAFVSVFIIKAVCVFCFSAYIINFLILFFSYKNRKASNTSLWPIQNNVLIFTTLLAVFHLLLPSIVERNVAGRISESEDLAFAQHFRSNAKAIVTEGYPSFGASKENAIIELVEYSDFQCPYCAKFNNMLKAFKKSNSDVVRVIYKPYPLDSKCNEGMKSSGHPLACDAAKVGLCINEKSGSTAYKDYHDAVFEQQSQLSSTLIKKLAADQSLSEKEISECLEKESIHNAVTKSIKEGTGIGVSGTPSFFVNKKRISLTSPRLLKKVLEEYRSQRK